MTIREETGGYRQLSSNDFHFEQRLEGVEWLAQGENTILSGVDVIKAY
jgi:hypothetical protein